MKKANKNGIKAIIHTNICLMILVLLLFILAILYKFLTYEKNEQNSIEASANVEDLYNITNIEQNNDNVTNFNKINKEINSNVWDWELLLVNKNNMIPENYQIQLESVEINHKVDKRVAEYLKQMLKDAREVGLEPVICSSYRTNEKQKILYKNKTKEYIRKGYSNKKAEELASCWVAIPGTGEHETGLAVDIVSKKYQILDENQENTDVQKWLMENSYKYGFILRYPTDKKDITLINYEPWHYRYVGIDNAKFINEHEMCLEEYIEYLQQFS